jgi:hypothetical protein
LVERDERCANKDENLEIVWHPYWWNLSPSSRRCVGKLWIPSERVVLSESAVRSQRTRR